MLSAIILFIICFVGSMIQGITGFGYAIFALTLLPFFIPFKTAVVAVSILAMLMTSSMAYKLREHIDKRVIAIPLIASIVGRSIGVYAFNRFETGFLVNILGIILISISVWMFYFADKLKIKEGKGRALFAGLASGLLGGMFNMGGPPLVIYFFGIYKDKLAYNATLQTIFSIGGMYTVFLHFLSGNITSDVLGLSVIGLASVILGSSVGLIIFSKVNKGFVGKFISVFICIMGFFLFIK